MAQNDTNQTVPPKREKEPQAEDIFDFEKEEKPRPAEIGKEVIPEVGKEKVPEIKPEKKKEIEEEVAKRKIVPPPKKAEPKVAALVKSKTVLEIENILSQDLDEIYGQMTPEIRKEFKQKGEETASRIEQLIKTVKVKVKEVLNLIKNWLKIIPGINKFFIEQEAKIKTDRIMALKEKNLKEKQK